MKHVLKVLNKELKQRKIRAEEWYENYNKLYKDYHDLKTENEILRKDLFELSQEHFKNKNK
jgi:hypothetical protein